LQPDLCAYLGHKCKEYGYHLYAVGAREDHVHVVVRLGPVVAVAEAARKLKGSSSRFCSDKLGGDSAFRWQAGYGALTFGKRDLPRVVAYVRDQEKHHAQDELDRMLESWGNP